MTRDEFGIGLAFLTAGTGKSLAPESIEVYWRMLGDLSREEFEAGVKLVLLEHTYSGFPTIEAIRRNATKQSQGSHVSAAEAFMIAAKAASQIRDHVDYIVVGGTTIEASEYNRKIIEALPPAVAKVLLAIGTKQFSRSDTCRAHFLRLWENQVTHEKEAAKLPLLDRRIVCGIGAMPKEKRISHEK